MRSTPPAPLYSLEWAVSTWLELIPYSTSFMFSPASKQTVLVYSRFDTKDYQQGLIPPTTDERSHLQLTPLYFVICEHDVHCTNPDVKWSCSQTLCWRAGDWWPRKHVTLLIDISCPLSNYITQIIVHVFLNTTYIIICLSTSYSRTFSIYPFLFFGEKKNHEIFNEYDINKISFLYMYRPCMYICFP